MMRFFSRAKILFVALLFVPFCAQAFSSPGKATGFINDFAGVLAKSEVVALNEKAGEIKRATGVEIAVALIPSLGGEDGKTYATDLFAEWGVGEKGRDNGLLLLVAIEERELHIEVGYGLEGAVTDLQAKQIIDDLVVPAFRAGGYALGIRGALDAIGVLVTTGEMPSSSPKDSFGIDVGRTVFLFVLFLGQFLISLMAKSKSWWLGGVFGGLAGTLVGYLFGSLLIGFFSVVFLVGLGLFLDYVVSQHDGRGGPPFMFFGGGGSGGGFGGGFGGFGGGSSGGGGASGRW